MQLPISRNALDRLGQRLSQPDRATDADYDLLRQVLHVYEAALSSVRIELEALGFAVANRLKTTSTLVEKLHRERGMKLTRVQDVAGARVVVRGTRIDQDEAVASIVAVFAGAAKPPQIRDRRSKPSAGYRAVHVIVFPGNLPVEVQVRTELQHLWAQVFERLGDAWGRAIRYGGLGSCFCSEVPCNSLNGRSLLVRRCSRGQAFSTCVRAPQGKAAEHRRILRR